MAEFEIVDGPSKWELALSLTNELPGRTALESRQTVTLWICIKGAEGGQWVYDMAFVVLSLERASWNDHAWKLKVELREDEGPIPYRSRLTGTYDSQKRRGSLDLVP